MSLIQMSLIEMSLSGAVLILAVVVLRALFLHRLPKRAFLALWGVAAARLLVPFSFRSAFSVYSLLGRLTAAGETAVARPAAAFLRVAPAQITLPAPNAAVHAATAAFPWGIVWGIGALACAGFFAAAYLKCRREFRASLPVENEHAKAWLRAQRIRRPVELRQSGRISAPLTYGVLRPVILMPRTTDWDDWDALKYVLAHELVHIRRFDAAAKLLLTAALCVHWFNPAAWVMAALANRDIELSCDEAVIRQFGERTRSAYAMTLIRMEETRAGLNPLGSHFSKNAIEERIVAIMKIKKTSLAALLAAVALVGGVTTAFATSAEEGAPRKDSGAAPVTATEAAEWLSIVTPEDGKTTYSFDGGETFEALTDEELKARYPSADVEWWTADEYAAWLENEKAELQSIIGERAWTSSRGEFVWTQEIVDETIAMYEGILENIKNGALYSKTIGGEDASVTLSSGSASSEAGTFEGEATASDFAIYAPFGLVWDEGEKALYWNGQRVRYFLDGADVDGGMAVRLECLDTELEGGIDVRAVRERVQNPDGSFDPFGPLTGLEAYSQAEYDANTQRIAAARDAQSAMTLESAEDWGEAMLSDYLPFGLSYRIEADETGGELHMRWQGKPVHSLFDAEKGVWIANSARGLYLGPDAVDLEAVYERGELVGLRETEAQAEAQTEARAEAGTADLVSVDEQTSAAEGNAAEPGTTFAEIFERYAPFGIRYEEAEGGAGMGNVYYGGRLVGRFADLTPGGGAFTFTSAGQGEIDVRTVYGEGGALAGVEIVGE